MAKIITNNMLCSNANNDVFRTWCTFVDTIFKLGFINVVDAADIDLLTVAFPTAVNMNRGFKIYRTNDGLTPVYFKVEFGSGAAALTPAVWITIGTEYTAGGTIGGVILLPTFQFKPTGQDLTTNHICFGSGAANRVCFAMFLSKTVCPFWFSFERRKDATIADVDTGVLIDGGLGVNLHFSLCAPFSGVIPTPEIGFQFILSTNNPAAYGNAIPEGLRIPCLGPSEPPGMNVAFCNANDYGEFAEPTLTINTTDVLFKQAGRWINSLRGSNPTPSDVYTRLLLRFD